MDSPFAAIGRNKGLPARWMQAGELWNFWIRGIRGIRGEHKERSGDAGEARKTTGEPGRGSTKNKTGESGVSSSGCQIDLYETILCQFWTDLHSVKRFGKVRSVTFSAIWNRYVGWVYRWYYWDPKLRLAEITDQNTVFRSYTHPNTSQVVHKVVGWTSFNQSYRELCSLTPGRPQIWAAWAGFTHLYFANVSFWLWVPPWVWARAHWTSTRPYIHREADRTRGWKAIADINTTI